MITPEPRKPISRGLAMKVLAMFASKDPIRTRIEGYCREVKDGFVSYHATDGCVLFTLRAPFEGEPERKNLRFSGSEKDNNFPNVKPILDDFQAGTVVGDIHLATWEPLSRIRRKNQHCNNHGCVCPHGLAAELGELNICGFPGQIELHRASTIYKAFRELHGKHSLIPTSVIVKFDEGNHPHGFYFETELGGGVTASVCLICLREGNKANTISLDPETLNLLGLMWDEKDAQKRAERAAQRAAIAETYTLPL